MNGRLTIDCGPRHEDGKRLVIALCGTQEHRDRFAIDNAFLRTKFIETVLTKFGWAITAEQVHEIEQKLIAVADAEDVRNERLTALSADAVRLSDVAPCEVEWLWPGRVALGKLTLLAGDPGVGKSYLTLDMAARVSRGGPWPEVSADPVDQTTSTAGSVILLSAEDDLADTIRPRLEAHGADCDKIVAICAIDAKDGGGRYRRTFDLARDLDHLEAELVKLPDCRLIVVDPISAYLGRSSENVNAEVRSLLGPLAALAAARRVAVVAVTHLRKGEGAAMHRSMGSMAFVAAARAAWVVCRDPQAAHRRLLLPLKNNLSTDQTGLAFTIEPLIPGDDPLLGWCAEPVSVRADDVLKENSPSPARRDHERREIVDWLAKVLAAGPQPTSEVRAAAEAHGFSYATLRRAFRELGGQAVRANEGMQVSWRWQLPQDVALA